jgi:hypothetical protein
MKIETHIPKTFTAALCILALSPALVLAGSQAKVSEERGLIKSVDMNAHTLIVSEQNKAERTFSWNEQTKFTEHNKAVHADALKAGEHVRLAYRPGGDTPILQSVRIIPAKAGKPTAGNPSTTSSANVKS